MKTKVFAAALMVLVVGGSALGQAIDPQSKQPIDTAKLDQFFDRLSEKDKAMGSMTITRDGVVSYTRTIGSGQINGEEKKPLTAFSRFRIGSVSKMFTATMVLQLIEEGKLKRTETLDKFFPQVPNASKITIEQMLAHRSGISDLTNDPGYRSSKGEPKTHEEVVALIAKRTPEFEPDAKFGYSNSGYILLGFIIEKVAGTTYQQALQTRIASKAGLADTSLGLGKIDAEKYEVASFRYMSGWALEPETHLSLPGGAGAIVSTPADMAKFIRALFDLKLVSKDSLDLMMQKQLGMESYLIDGKVLYGHGGSIDGFKALLMYLPDEKLAIAYTSNGVNYPVAQVVEDALAIARGRPFQIPIFESVAVSTEALDAFAGTYTSADMPVKFTVARKGSTLTVQPEGKSAIELEATAPDKFKCDPMGLILEFDAAKKQMIFKRRGREAVFTKES